MQQKRHWKKEVCNHIGSPQETRKTSNNLTLHTKELKKEETTSKVSRSKERIRLRIEVNEREARKDE